MPCIQIFPVFGTSIHLQRLLVFQVFEAERLHLTDFPSLLILLLTLTCLPFRRKKSKNAFRLEFGSWLPPSITSLLYYKATISNIYQHMTYSAHLCSTLLPVNLIIAEIQYCMLLTFLFKLTTQRLNACPSLP